jgi:hypothetical protein
LRKILQRFEPRDIHFFQNLPQAVRIIHYKFTTSTDCKGQLAAAKPTSLPLPWVYSSTKVIGFDQLTASGNASSPDVSNMTIALTACRTNGHVFAVEGPVFVNQIVSWCNESDDEPQWEPFLPFEASCFPAGPPKNFQLKRIKITLHLFRPCDE